MKTLLGRVTTSAVVGLFILGFMICPDLRANDGVPDPTCGTGGKVTVDIFGSMDNDARAAAVQTDGKVVVAGYVKGSTEDFALARYNADGSLDNTFGLGGIVTTDFSGGNDRVFALAIQTDGRIVAAGYAVRTGTHADFALARYNTDGSLDTGFGSGGKVTTNFFSAFDGARALAIQGDGKMVVAGTAVFAGAQRFALARYNVDGSLDASFGTGGKTTTTIMGLDDEAESVAVQSDGKIVAGGFTWIGGLNFDFALVRYSGVDGSLDASFGTGGVVTTDFAGGDDDDFALAIDANGRIVAGGESLSSGSIYQFALARYNAADGSLDTTFGSGGKVTTDFGGGWGSLFSITFQPGGLVLAAGAAVNPGGDVDMALARYNPSDGSLDSAFGVGGKVLTDFSGSADAARAVVLLTAGRILAVGTATAGTTGHDFGLARYFADGTLDTAWGTAGKVTTDLLGSTPNKVSAIAIQTDGKMVAAGSTARSGADFALARINSNGTLDASFGIGGIVVTDFGGNDNTASSAVVQPDGKIVAAGTVGANVSIDINDFALVRYNADGSLDPTFGTGGRVLTDVHGAVSCTTLCINEIFAIALQVDNRIVAAGISTDYVTGASAFALARYNTDGSLDPTFGSGGTVTTSFFGPGDDDEALSVAIQADQKIVVAGYATDNLTFGPRFALARYNADGSLDAGFGSGGLLTTSFFGNEDEAFAVAVQADQKIVVAGHAVDAAPEIALARYNADGSLDASFGSGGLVTLSILGNDDEAFALALASDQKIVVTGYALGAARQVAVARFNADGRITAGGFAVGSTTGLDFAIVRYFVCGFLDVGLGNLFHEDICSVAQAGITAGCGGGNYCPDASVTRAQMAVFLLKSEHGVDYVPPACHGVFPDVPCPSPFADWIEQLAAEGITAGCGGGNYCPGSPVTRAQMAAFLLKTEHGVGYVPPVCTGIFGDVACPSQFANWIEALYGEGITGGCQASPLLYCPDNPNTRGQMAVFLTKTFHLPLY